MSDGKKENEQIVAPHPPSAQLLRLADFDPANATRIISDMRAYWHSLRRGRAIPARADIEPRGIHRALDYAFILERMAPGAARFRLAGRHLIDLMGMEVRGMPLCAFLHASSRGRFSDVLESVFKAPQLAELTLHAKAEYGRPELSARMLLMPLRSDLGDVTRSLGCLISEGNLGMAPRRFDLVADQVMPIIDGGRTVEPSPSARGLREQPTGLRNEIGAAQRKIIAPDPAKSAPTTPEERRAMFRVIPGPGTQHG